MSNNPPKWEPPSDPFNLTGKYILKHRKPVECPDLYKWGKWLQAPYNKRVRSTYIGNAWISTVFLGLDHRFHPEEHSKPVLFERIVFTGNDGGCDMSRACTWREALKMHWEMVRKIKDEQ